MSEDKEQIPENNKTKKVGRPKKYNLKLAQEICNTIAETSWGLYDLCEGRPNWPAPQTIRRWRREDEEFCSMYARAKQDQADFLAEECLKISDDTSHDTLIKTNSNGDDYEVCNSEWINRSRLRVDTRKWLASKLLPKVYGDKIQAEHSGTIQKSNLNDEELIAKAKEAITNASRKADSDRNNREREQADEGVETTPGSADGSL